MEHPQYDERDLTHQDGAGPERPRSAKRRTRKIRWNVAGSYALLAFFGLIVLIFLYSFVHRTILQAPVAPELMREGKKHVIQLDVLNGTTIPKLGRRVADYLRARGFDVVELGNFRHSAVESTHVIDRGGDIQAARHVARALGVPEERIKQEIDPHAYLDVTVVIGQDYQTLRPLR